MSHPVRSEPGTAIRAGSSRSCCSLQVNIQGLSGAMVLRQNLGEEMKLLAEAWGGVEGRGLRLGEWGYLWICMWAVRCSVS